MHSQKFIAKNIASTRRKEKRKYEEANDYEKDKESI
jgi:hypothetical protein